MFNTIKNFVNNWIVKPVKKIIATALSIVVAAVAIPALLICGTIATISPSADMEKLSAEKRDIETAAKAVDAGRKLNPINRDVAKATHQNHMDVAQRAHQDHLNVVNQNNVQAAVNQMNAVPAA